MEAEQAAELSAKLAAKAVGSKTTYELDSSDDDEIVESDDLTRKRRLLLLVEEGSRYQVTHTRPSIDFLRAIRLEMTKNECSTVLYFPRGGSFATPIPPPPPQ